MNIKKIIQHGTIGMLTVAGSLGIALADHGSDDRRIDDRNRTSSSSTSSSSTSGSSGSSSSSSTSGSSSGSTSTEVRLRTQLSGAAIQGFTPHGEAEFRSIASRTRSELKVDVENVNLLADTMLDVTVTPAGGSPQNIGQIRLNSLGEGELDLNSQDGDVVPAIQSGVTVTVLNAGTPILAGVF